MRCSDPLRIQIQDWTVNSVKGSLGSIPRLDSKSGASLVHLVRTMFSQRLVQSSGPEQRLNLSKVGRFGPGAARHRKWIVTRYDTAQTNGIRWHQKNIESGVHM